MSRKQVAVSSNYWEGEVVFWTPYDPYDSVTYDKFCGQVAKEVRDQNKNDHVSWLSLRGSGALLIRVIPQTKEEGSDRGKHVAAIPKPEDVPQGWKPASDGDGFEPTSPYHDAGGIETYHHRRAG